VKEVHTHVTVNNLSELSELLYGPCITCVYFMSNFSLISLQYFENVFVCGFVGLFLCCLCFVVAAFI
jgi:hypothetical protein